MPFDVGGPGDEGNVVQVDYLASSFSIREVIIAWGGESPTFNCSSNLGFKVFQRRSDMQESIFQHTLRFLGTCRIVSKSRNGTLMLNGRLQ